MTEIIVGKAAQAFSMIGAGGEKIASSALKGSAYVLYFYPKADTTGCTKEALGFQETLAAFAKLGVKVIGVSRDPVKALDKFAAKYGLTFSLASDEDGAVCEKYGVWVEKSMYGRKYMGIELATFLIRADGKVAAIWRKVKILGHVDAVLATAKGL